MDNPENWKRDETPKSLYNPLTEDFTVTYRDDNNTPIPYTIHAGEIETFPKYLADHIEKHLAQKLVFDRGMKPNYEDAFKKAVLDIQVEL